jgi:hypothetical protein
MTCLVFSIPTSYSNRVATERVHPLWPPTSPVAPYIPCGRLHPLWPPTSPVAPYIPCGSLHPLWPPTSPVIPYIPCDPLWPPTSPVSPYTQRGTHLESGPQTNKTRRRAKSCDTVLWQNIFRQQKGKTKQKNLAPSFFPCSFGRFN